MFHLIFLNGRSKVSNGNSLRAKMLEIVQICVDLQNYKELDENARNKIVILPT